MPATDKSELLAVTMREWTKLTQLLDKVPDDLACAKDSDDTSIKDVVAHRAHWIDLFLGWYAEGQAGATVHFPAPGYKWSDLNAYNAKLRAEQAGLSWDDARGHLNAAHDRLLDQLNGLDDPALYGGKMKGGRNAWTTGRWAEAAGPSHYRSAAKYIRARLRAA